MKRKILLPILLAIVFGYLCANYVYALYKEEDNTTNVYFLQEGVYKSLESVEELKNLPSKLILKEDDKYYVYVGITSSLDQAKMIKNIYENNNINLYIKEKIIDNDSFLSELEQYDILLKNAKSFEEINNVFETVVATYEEKVLDKWK